KAFPSSLHSLQSNGVEILKRIRGLIGKSLHTARLVELQDARPRPFSKGERAKLIAIESVHRARNPACSHGQNIKIVPDSRSRCDAVRYLGWISLEIEQLFPAAVRHENVLPLIGHDHEFEIL